MADLNLKLVISGSNDGAIAALNQVVERSRASGTALAQADSAGTFGKTRAGVESISSQLGRLQTIAASAASGSFLLSLGRDAIRASEEIKGIEARLKLAVTSWGEYKQALAGVRDVAFQSGTAVAANVAMVTRVADPIREMGGAQRDVLSITQAVNNALRISNATTAEGSAAMLQFAQAMGSGVLRGEELNSILENAPRLAKAIAVGLGVTVGELKALGEQGALTSKQVFNALRSQQAALADEAARLPVTVGMAWTNVGEGVKKYVAEVDSATGATSALAKMLNTVAGNVPAIGGALAEIAIVMAVAFGARQLSVLAAYVTGQRAQSAATRIATGDAVRQAETQVAVQQAIVQKTAAELRAIPVIKSYSGVTNEAATADQRRALAARLVSENQALVAAKSGLLAAQSVSAAASVGLLGRMLGIAGTAGRGLIALFGGPLGAAVTAITVGVMAWEHFAAKSKSATTETGSSLKELTDRFGEFSGKSGPEEAAKALSDLKEKAASAREQLASPLFRASKEGQAMAADLKRADEAIERFDQQVKVFQDSHTKERGLLGLDKLKLDAGGLVSDDVLKQLNAFSTLYKDFVSNAIGDNNKLKASALEVKAALATLLASAKTPAEFNGLVSRIGEALKASPKDSTLKSQLENAIEARMQSEMKALNSLVAGLEARSQRTQSLFKKSADIALAQYSQAAALAKVSAELKGDVGGASQIDTNSRNAEIAVAQQSAGLQMQSLDQVSTRKRELIQQGLKDTQAAARDEADAAQRTSREKISVWEGELAKGIISKEQMADREAKLAKETSEKVAASRESAKQAEISASRQLREVDAETAQQRAAIAEGLYKTLQAKSQQALSSYQQHAQQVIQLDKAISNNRLDTASAVAGLQRKGMTPADQVNSLRDELAQVQAATAKALSAGQKDYALEMLNRQKALAQQIGQASGNGLDEQSQIAEGSAELERIGAEAEKILQSQRDAAKKAADTQLKSYEEMSSAMNKLAEQITKLNEQSAIKIKPEIDKASMDAAIAAVQQAFAGVTIPVKVQAVGLPNGAADPAASAPARAFGGELPGSAPHDRADNQLYWGTPGEWVIQRPAVRHYGADWIAAVNSMRLPKYAFGGAIGGGSAVNRLAIPSLQAPGSGGEKSMYGNFYLGDKSFEVQSKRSTFDELASHLNREALRKGSPR